MERLGCLPRTQLAAVPDRRGRNARSFRLLGEPFRLCTPADGERTLRIDGWTDRVGVMNKDDIHGLGLEADTVAHAS